jgi:transcriptional regulator with GAF, ATPase, and Fis domain
VSHSNFFYILFSIFIIKWKIGQLKSMILRWKESKFMVFDDRNFFREATLKICGSLEIENALWKFLLFVREIIPADMIFLNVYDPGKGIIETVARADLEGGRTSSIHTVIPESSRGAFAEVLSRPDREPYLYTVQHMRDHEIADPFSRTLGMPEAPALVMRPKLEGKLLGGVVIVNNRGVKYSPEHVRLLSLLNEPFAIALSNYLRYREVARLKDLLADDNRYLHEELRGQVGEEIIGANFGLKGVMALVRQVAPLSSPVLLLGETGAGKELVASAIHRWSPRNEGPFIKVNCGAIPETLIDSELFGHEKGAFTGALGQKRGRFERAHRGTIFLDEIGDLPHEAQARLLRVLQEKEVERVGGTGSIKVDIRVIAATHRNLEALLEAGRFREDLYFRLRVFPIAIPPLRDRLPDIPALVQHFMQKKAREMGLAHTPTLAPNSIDRLMSYHWPGNVRELQNAVERALILSKEQPLTFEDLGIPDKRSAPALSPGRPDCDSLDLNLAVSRHIIHVLEMTGGRVGGEKGAARMMGINSSTLRKKMGKLGIPFGRRAAVREIRKSPRG